MTTRIIAVLCVLLVSSLPPATAQEITSGSAVSLKQDTTLHFKDHAYRVAKAGETFRVAVHRPQEKRVYIYALDPRGADIALWVEESAITTKVARSGEPQKTFANSFGMKFAPVPIVGGPTGGQRILFSIWDTRVKDYRAFAEETKREWPKVFFKQNDQHPAVNVSWNDARAYCEWLTGRERSRGVLPTGYSYRLPSDHEWSCAVGIGDREDASKSPRENSKPGIVDVFPWGKQWPPPKGSGNFAEDLQVDEYEYTSPVGSFAANNYGLYDMAGNVWQWCGDWYDGQETHRVLRGGFFDGFRELWLSSARYVFFPKQRIENVGFRCVLAPSVEDTNPHR